MSKKPDYSHINIPALKQFCADNNLNFTWKNELHGHAVVSNSTTEIYVWVQRMVCQIRIQNGNLLSKPIMVNANRIFQDGWFKRLISGTKKKVRLSHFTRGVVVTRIKQGTPANIVDDILHRARLIASQHSRARA